MPVTLTMLPFPDVSNSWYSDAVHWATHEGIINGYNNGKFGPNDPVTREQIAVILWRYAKYAGYEMSTGKTMIFVVRCWDLGTMLTITHYGCIFGMSC